MDPLSLIVTALATGAAAVAQSAVGDAYAAVRDLLRKRFSGVGVETLERDPASAARQQVVKEDLESSQAVGDTEFLEQMQRLVEAIEESAAAESRGGPAIDLKAVQAASLVIKKILAEGPNTAVLRADTVTVGGTFQVEDVTIRGTGSDPKA